ncbi:hypothetical protein [Piscinibacter sp.]|jgi:hypothetical protein|uniref:hypothetical protein n=1 Tax=Piscinibacter sp. TaxID=1903157 RepID=UPI003559E18B
MVFLVRSAGFGQRGRAMLLRVWNSAMVATVEARAAATHEPQREPRKFGHKFRRKAA